ncbi:hypothetical protein [Psychroserpens sp.]|uniref:hypothetical protein n=1 Tax=Psychroserpens sp. TaxID=2020870 RepID=UPI003858BF50
MKILKLILAMSLISGVLTSCSSTKQTTSFKKDYQFDKVVFDIKDNNVKLLLENQINKTKFRKGQSLNTSTFIKERKRIVKLIRKNHNPDFSEDKISFVIDTTLSKNRFSVTTIVKK